MTAEFVLNASNYASYQLYYPVIRSSGFNSYPNKLLRPSRKNADYEFIYVTKGSCLFTIEEQSFLCKSGDLVFIPRSAFHSYQSADLPLSFYFVHFKLYASEMQSYFSKGLYSFTFENVSQSQSLRETTLELNSLTRRRDLENYELLFQRIVQLRKSNASKNSTLIKALFIELIASLFESGTAPAANEVVTDLLIQSIIDYILAHYSEKLTIDSILQNVSKPSSSSVSTINLMFKHVTGMSIIEYLIYCRISFAEKELHADPSTSLEHLAFDLGFYDIHHFSNTFKKVMGISPGKYKNILLNHSKHDQQT